LFLPLRFSYQIFVCIAHFPHTCYIHSSSHFLVVSEAQKVLQCNEWCLSDCARKGYKIDPVPVLCNMKMYMTVGGKWSSALSKHWLSCKLHARAPFILKRPRYPLDMMLGCP
jgi:hypothetical protein